MARVSIALKPGALQRELDAKGLDHAAVGRALSLDRRSIWRLATGRVTRTSVATAQRLVWLLDVRPSDLFVMPTMALDESHTPPR